MNKIKKLWNENRVMLVLGMIVLLCIVIIMVVMFQYFFGATSSSYGDRLSDIQDHPFTSEAQTQLKESFASEHLLDTNVTVRGKIIYVILTYDETVAMAEAQKKAVDVYNALEETYRKLYDFNVTLLQEKSESSNGYHIMGAKNVSGDNFVWSNNTPVEDGE